MEQPINPFDFLCELQPLGTYTVQLHIFNSKTCTLPPVDLSTLKLRYKCDDGDLKVILTQQSKSNGDENSTVL